MWIVRFALQTPYTFVIDAVLIAIFGRAAIAKDFLLGIPGRSGNTRSETERCLEPTYDGFRPRRAFPSNAKTIIVFVQRTSLRNKKLRDKRQNSRHRSF